VFNAIYYPYTAVRSESFLKHALLYWDEIEYISPFRGYNDLGRYPEPVLRELSRILRPHVPTKEEKKRAHDEIMTLVSGDLPHWLTIDRTAQADERRLYSMFSHKLLKETWEELKARNLVVFQRHGDIEDYASHTYLGLTLMAILARCCAGTVKHTITDQDDSYFSLLKHLQYLSGDDVAGKDQLDPASQKVFKRWLTALGVTRSRAEDEARETLISISLNVIGASDLSVDSLLELRHDKKQLGAQLRQNYAKAIEAYVAKLSTPGLTETDAKAIADDFSKQMELDRDRLFAELRLSALKTALSKEVAVGVIAPFAGSIVLTATGIGSILGGALGAAAIGRAAIEYRSARNAVFEKHPMAFLYSKQPLRIY